MNVKNKKTKGKLNFWGLDFLEIAKNTYLKYKNINWYVNYNNKWIE